MASWVAYQEYHLRTGALVVLKVEAYDPRDYLAGHYLIYRVDYNDTSLCTSRTGEELCVCLAPQGNYHSASWHGSCESRPGDSCELYLHGRCDWRGFNAGIERYYISEELASRHRTIPPHSSIHVRLDGNGGGIVSGFYVDQVPLEELPASQ